MTLDASSLILGLTCLTEGMSESTESWTEEKCKCDMPTDRKKVTLRSNCQAVNLLTLEQEAAPAQYSIK